MEPQNQINPGQPQLPENEPRSPGQPDPVLSGTPPLNPQPLPPQQPVSDGIVSGGVIPPAASVAPTPLPQPTPMPEPMVSGGMTTAPTSVPVASLNGKSRGGLKKVLLIVIVVVMLAIIGGGGYVLWTMFGASVPRFSSKDSKEYSSNNYTYMYPSNWNDAKDSEYVKQLIQGVGVGSDSSVLAYKVSKDGKKGQAAVFAATQLFPASDAQLKAALADPTQKKQFEDEILSSIDNQGLAKECETLANKKHSFNYDNKNYIVSFSFEEKCIYTSEKQKDYNAKSATMIMQAGIKNQRLYVMVIVANDKIWQKNENYFKNDMIASFKPKT